MTDEVPRLVFRCTSLAAKIPLKQCMSNWEISNWEKAHPDTKRDMTQKSNTPQPTRRGLNECMGCHIGQEHFTTGKFMSGLRTETLVPQGVQSIGVAAPAKAQPLIPTKATRDPETVKLVRRIGDLMAKDRLANGSDHPVWSAATKQAVVELCKMSSALYTGSVTQLSISQIERWVAEPTAEAPRAPAPKPRAAPVEAAAARPRRSRARKTRPVSHQDPAKLEEEKRLIAEAQRLVAIDRDSTHRSAVRYSDETRIAARALIAAVGDTRAKKILDTPNIRYFFTKSRKELEKEASMATPQPNPRPVPLPDVQANPRASQATVAENFPEFTYSGGASIVPPPKEKLTWEVESRRSQHIALSGGRDALLNLPDPITKKDAERIAALVLLLAVPED